MGPFKEVEQIWAGSQSTRPAKRLKCTFALGLQPQHRDPDSVSKPLEAKTACHRVHDVKTYQLPVWNLNCFDKKQALQAACFWFL